MSTLIKPETLGTVREQERTAALKVQASQEARVTLAQAMLSLKGHWP